MAPTRAGEQTRAAQTLVLDPRIRRVGFAYFEAAILLDWGVRNVRNGEPKTRSARVIVPHLVRMLDEFEPAILLVPAVGTGGTRRSVPVQETVDAIVREARGRGIVVNAVTDRDVTCTFRSVVAGRMTKHTIAKVVAKWFPELGPRLPRPRRLWEPERHGTPMFNAVAMYRAWQGLPAKSQGEAEP